MPVLVLSLPWIGHVRRAGGGGELGMSTRPGYLHWMTGRSDLSPSLAFLFIFVSLLVAGTTSSVDRESRKQNHLTLGLRRRGEAQLHQQ